MRLRTAVLPLLVGGALLLSACTEGGSGSESVTASSGARAATAQRDVPADDLGEVPVFPGPYTRQMALAPGLLPPTNSWIAPAVFDPDDRPVFTGTLSARLTQDGVAVGLPRPETSAKVVMGSHRDDLRLGLPAAGYALTRTGAVDATLTYQAADGSALGDLTLAEGWPYLAYTARVGHQLTLPQGLARSGDGWELEVDGTRYRVLTPAEPEGSDLLLDPGESLLVYALPEDADAELVAVLDAGAVPLEGTSLEREVGGRQVRTTVHYTTVDGRATVVGAAPHRAWEGGGLESAEGLEDAAYPTVLGSVPLARAKQLTWTTPVQQAITELDLDGLDRDERERVVSALEQDVSELAFAATDSYHAGKELQRSANLYLLARQLGREDLTTTVKDAMVEQLDRWFEPEGCATRVERCFYYDQRLRGMVGKAPSYGSDEFNDHHFHYGHFLYAAGILAADDERLGERWAPVADLVARDFGAPQESSHFPAHRVFDPWRGHSFASGTAPFADGNNQESSSEAVNAWVGLTAWARARGDADLADAASWLLAEETAATRAYWLDTSQHLDEAFAAPAVSLNWQGKRDFATFFSAEPSAVVGIQLIPMGPTQVDYLSREPEVLDRMLDAVGPLEPGRPLVDLDVLALSLVDPRAGAEALELFDRTELDPGMSMSYALALVLSR